MISFSSHTVQLNGISNVVSAQLGQARQDWEAKQPPRQYLGCSYLGDECERKVQYTYLKKTDFDGQLLRIFDRGHWIEEYLITWLRRAGYGLLTEDPATSGQFGVSFLDGRIRGHADGIIVGAMPGVVLPFEVPALWECKGLGDKSWKDLCKRKLRASKPTYYGQVQLYMFGLGLSRCLFTACNSNTMELRHELVEYDEMKTMELLTRGERVLMYSQHGEMVSRAFESTDYRCKYCDFRDECWTD